MLKVIDRKKLTDEEKLDAELAKMKRLPRGRFKTKPGETDPRNCKVKVTMYIDADVLEYFKNRAEQPNAAPYQTQINNELRKVMERGSEAAENNILNDTKFLKALKKKLETV
jgi:uncharacterized protein (DUF4415 family)